MTTPHDHNKNVQAEANPGRKGHRGHGWMMIACCVPMLAIALILVLTGVISAGWLIVAVACTVMMAAMMAGMGGDRGGS